MNKGNFKRSFFIAVACALIGLRLSTQALAFNHPGIPLTTYDLDAVKANTNTEPWKSGYASLAADSHSQLTYTMQGPFAKVSRNDGGLYTNENQWKNDMQAIFNQSLMWYFTGNNAYAQNAHDILLAWGTTQSAFTGIEAPFDLGDYAFCYAGGADILRGTWPGWTASDTTTVQNYFNNVFWPCLGFSAPMPTGSQGTEPLAAGVAIAIFDDDWSKLNLVLNDFLGDADAGLRNTLPNGEVGDTGRDQGHTSLYVYDLAFIAEVFWKQGMDVYSLLDNRILAAGEYYARYNLPGPTPAFVSFGAPFWGPFWSIGGTPRSSTQSRRALNILHGAYAVRKGLNCPWIDLYDNDQVEDNMSFLFRKTADTSTATPATLPTIPSASTITSGFTNTDLNGATPAGSGLYSSGTWTLAGGYNGGDPWSSSAPTVHFAYKQMTGDFMVQAKVTSIANVGNSHAKAGIMLRDTSSGTASNQVSVSVTPALAYERVMTGWTGLPYGSNAAALSFSIQQLPYWVRLERVGNRIQTYVSVDGGSWSPAGTADFANLPSTVYAGLYGTSMVTGSSSTATFTNVSMSGGDGGNVPVPNAPFLAFTSPGDHQVVVRWTESAGATSYKVKRTTTTGGPYTTIGTVSATTSYTDFTAVNGTSYYYVVSAVNSAGESANCPEDSATPQPAKVNVAINGMASASNANSSTEGGSVAFDSNPGSKWFTGDTYPTGWVQYDLGAGITQIVTTYAITSGADVLGRDPAAWQFQASNDGSTWTTLDTQSSQIFPYRYQTLYYPITNSTGYRYYRLNVTANAGGSGYGLQLSELALLKIGAATPPPTAPSGLSTTAYSPSRIDLSWTGYPDASSYVIRQATTSGGPYTIIASGVGGTSYSNTGLAANTTYYYVVSALNSGGESVYSAEASAPTMGTLTISATSNGTQDGYILAASGNTTGGSISSSGALRVGDNNQNRQYKSILSFDTSTIPENAVIVSATLSMRCSAINGTNPFSALGTCYVDIKGGPGFNNSTTLETADFQAAADATQVATMSSVSSVGTWSTASLNAAGLGIVNKLGTTQLRAYFSTPTNNNSTSDYISWNSGDDATTSYRPVLQVVYYLDVPSTQPKAYLRFDESSGSTASDSSGNGWTGTLVSGSLGSPTWGAGKLNNAVNVTGGSYISLPPGAVSYLGDFTVSAWVKLNTISNNARIFDFGTSTAPSSTTGSYMFLTPSSGSGVVRFAMTTAGYSNEQAVVGTAPLSTSTWTHVAVTLSGSTCTLYVNGSSVGSNTGVSLKPYSLGSTTQNFLGKSQYSSDPALDGAADEFRIYDRALSPSEITALNSPPVITSTLNVICRTGSSLNYQIAATKAPTSYSATGLPSGVSLTPATGLISGTPTSTGTYNVALGAINPAGTGSATLVLSVLPPAPVIQSSGTVNGFTNAAFSYQITASNTPTSYGASGLPTGVSVDSSSGLISGTPTVSGTFNSSISATNAGGTGTGNLSIVLAAQLTAPSGLSASAGNATVSLTWNAVDGARSYNIKRSTTSGSGYNVVASGETGTAYVDPNVSNWTTYYYVVSAVNSSGEGPNSTEASAMPVSSYTWTGSGADANWQTSANWSTLPTSGVTLYFAGSTQTSNTNNFATNTSFTGFVFNSGAGAFALGGNAITLAGDIVNNSTSTQGISLPTAITGANRTVNAVSGNISLTGSLSGGVGLIKSGPNALTLSGNNTFSGGLIHNAGMIIVSSNNALGSGILTLASGTLQSSANVTLANPIFVQTATNSSLATNGNNLTLSGNLTGNGNITRSATGNPASVYLSGSNSGFSGTFTANADSPEATRFTSTTAGSENASWVINTPVSTRASVEFSGTGTIRFGSLTGTGYLTAAGSSGIKTIEVGNLGLDESFAGVFNESGGVGAITKVGAGTWTVTGLNTYSGATTISAGALAISGSGTLGASSGSLIVSGGLLDLASKSRTKGAVSISNGSIISGTLTGTSFISTDGGVISASLSGTGATLTKSGSGTLTLTGMNTFAGATSINSGTLKLTGSLASAVTINSGGTLAGTGTSGPVTVGKGGAIAPGNLGPGTFTITGTCILNNGAVLNMEIGNSSDLIQLTGAIAATGTSTINLNAAPGFAGGTYSLIANAGSITAGNFTLGNVPAGYGGTLNASGGVLSVTLTQIPNSPASPTITASDSSASLAWSSVSGASSYNVKRSTTSGSGYVLIANVSTTSYPDTGLLNGTTYYYVVSAVNSGGESANSAEASALPLSAIQAWRLDNFGTIANTGIAADTADPDGDGMTNAQEFAAGTDPNNSSSVLKITQTPSGIDMLLSFPSVVGKTYRVEYSGTLQAGSWTAIQDNIAGSGATIAVADTNGAAQPKRFYRVLVH